MKILLDNGGQTCNKFWSYIPLLQEGLKRGERFIVPFFDKELENYPRLLNNKIFIYPSYCKPLLRLFGYKKLMYYLTLPINNRFYDITHWLLQSRYVIDSWGERNIIIEQDVLKEIKSFFLPNSTIQDGVVKEFEKYRIQGRKIIGIHIRRGDYKYWRDGAYYYGFEDYAKICNELNRFWGGESKPLFFLASNEKIPTEIFQDIDAFSLKSRSMPADLFALSSCDYLIGPPSTFSQFASFMGGGAYLFYNR